jgi:acetoin utilization deacetylase AcuC-like enzyme
MRWFYDPGYDYGHGLPDAPSEVHGFLLAKPSRIRDALVAAGTVWGDEFVRPEPVTEAEIAAVHGPGFLEALHDPEAVAAAVELDAIALLPPELVWGAVVAPQIRAAGGTCEALRIAAQGEWAANLSGGFHHARPDLAHGFCLVNDVALAVARLRGDGAAPPILIVDLDLHQGDGNAVFFAGDPLVYTLSLHEEGLFPFPKARSDLDVGLASGCGDEPYLATLDAALARARAEFEPCIVLYLAGSDPFERDPLGSLRLSRAGLLARDRRVARFAREQGCGLLALPAGGYSPASPELTARGFAAIAAEGEES